MLSDEQMRKIWPFSLLNDEQMSNKVEVKHQPASQDVGVLNSHVLSMWDGDAYQLNSTGLYADYKDSLFKVG